MWVRIPPPQQHLNNKIMKELITIQSELKAPKNQTNKFGGYKYRSAEDILEAVKPLCQTIKPKPFSPYQTTWFARVIIFT